MVLMEIKKSKAEKHIIVDTLALLMVAKVHAANIPYICK